MWPLVIFTAFDAMVIVVQVRTERNLILCIGSFSKEVILIVEQNEGS